MSEFEGEIDQELRAEFIDESVEELDQVSGLMVDLESNPDDKDLLEPIFRAVHSIKGNSAYFGALKTKSLAHKMEDVLDLLRKDALSATGDIVDVLLRGVDQLQLMLDRTRDGNDEVQDPDHFNALLDEVKSIAEKEKQDEETLWNEILARLQETDNEALLKDARALAEFYPAGRAALGESPSETETDGSAAQPEDLSGDIAEQPDSLSEALETLKLAFADEDTPPPTEAVRNALHYIDDNTTSPDAEEIIHEAMSDLDLWDGLIGLDDPAAREAFDEYIPNIESAIQDDINMELATSETSTSPEGAKGPQKTDSTEKDSKATGKTMRIPEETIDVFLSYVGELVTIGEMYGNLHTNLLNGKSSQQAATELRRINESFNDLSQDLQSSIMEIRKVPMNVILRRVPRMVRGIAGEEGKKIDVSINGEKVMADKSLVNTLEAPLTHMVRNAADHGIETPEDREEAGKPPEGNIEVTAKETEEHIVLSVRDDGAGLDRDALKEKAIELDVISPGAELTNDDIVDLLFQSGVSTADEVTDVSGRGVGMDVVKRNIDNMGGDISVSTEMGAGSEFKVELPKTVSTEIIDGFIVVVDDNRYVFPMQNIVRCFRPEPSDIETVQGKGECVKTSSELIRICRLGECFDHQQGHQRDENLQDSVLVVVETESQPLAICVDDIDGVRQVVLKDIDGLVEDNPLFRGGAVMGDGSVAMIMDVDQLIDIESPASRRSTVSANI